jgi:hypothetical protein
MRPTVIGSPALRLKSAKEGLAANAANKTRDIMGNLFSQKILYVGAS